MPSEEGQAPDWRDADVYAPLLAAERAVFAWEWLRRNPVYRRAARVRPPPSGGPCPRGGEDPAAALWGLHRFEDPALAAPQARPVWRAARHPLVLACSAERDSSAQDAFSLARFRALATLVPCPFGAEHLLLSDGLRSVRLDIWRGSIVGAPVRLHYRLAGVAAIEGPLLALRRLVALCKSGTFQATLYPREARARRFILMLRAYDGLTAGATQREIAAELLDEDAREARWRVRAPSVRSQAQRLARSAADMARGGHWRLLA